MHWHILSRFLRGVILAWLPVLSANAEVPANFHAAKMIARYIYRDHRTTFYCGCSYDKHHKIKLESCGYKIQHNKRRAHRLEWEHIVPVSLWGKSLPCWNYALCCQKKKCYKGRACCRKQDCHFSKMEADLHNLVPEIGELNSLRANYQFGLLPFIAQGKFGACEIKIDQEMQRVEPCLRVRGAIARAYLYMSQQYGISLSKSQMQLYKAWNRKHPPDSWEIERNKRIQYFQGNHNPYIFQYWKKVHE